MTVFTHAAVVFTAGRVMTNLTEKLFRWPKKAQECFCGRENKFEACICMALLDSVVNVPGGRSQARPQPLH